MICAHKVKEPRKCRVFWLARHQKQRYLRCFLGPEGFQTLAKHRNVAVFGALRASPTVRQQAFELVFLFYFFLQMLVWWRIIHRYASTNRRPYAQQPIYAQTPLHTDAFTQRNLCTEQLLHEEKILPPKKKTGKHVFELGSFRFLTFPFQIRNANG